MCACASSSNAAWARGLLAPHAVGDVVRDLLTYLPQPAPDAAVADAGGRMLDAPGRAGPLWAAP